MRDTATDVGDTDLAAVVTDHRADVRVLVGGLRLWRGPTVLRPVEDALPVWRDDRSDTASLGVHLH